MRRQLFGKAGQQALFLPLIAVGLDKGGSCSAWTYRFQSMPAKYSSRFTKGAVISRSLPSAIFSRRTPKCSM
jgi:hypothetical protein